MDRFSAIFGHSGVIGNKGINVTVAQSPANSEADFNQDIVIRFKASERGAAAVIDPRYVVRMPREPERVRGRGRMPGPCP